ncbi:HTH-type transcriptional regulator PgrR [bacterium HR40]|nr:HTH-type transcriptional regulator PgrR [bacterium HR40]
MDTLEAMRSFVAVAECGGMTHAARRLGLAKSTVSKQIGELERRLGLALVNRNSRRLSLTPAGEAWLATCRRVLAEVEAGEGELAARSGLPRGRLRVSAPVSFSLLHLSPLVPQFLAAHPQIELELVLDDRHVDLVAEGFDLAVRIGRLPDSSLVARRLGEARTFCVASPAYLARRGRPRHPRELIDHDCLRYLNGRELQAWSFEQNGRRVVVPVRGRFIANNGDVLRDAALADFGIARLPSFLVARDLAAGRLEPLLEDWTTTGFGIYAVFPRHRPANPAVRAFVDFLTAALASAPRQGQRKEPQPCTS